jgi:hypothetical protein
VVPFKTKHQNNFPYLHYNDMNLWPQYMQHQGWFQDWLQGIVSRAATQQGFFAAIYEPVIVPSALINEANNTNGENSAIAKPTTAADQPSGLRGSAVIGNNSKNNNTANTGKGGEGDAKSQHEGN